MRIQNLTVQPMGGNVNIRPKNAQVLFGAADSSQHAESRTKTRLKYAGIAAALLSVVGLAGVEVSRQKISPNEGGVIVNNNTGHVHDTPALEGRHLVVPVLQRLERFDLSPQTVEDNMIIDVWPYRLTEKTTIGLEQKPALMNVHQLDSEFNLTWQIDPARLPDIQKALMDPDLNRHLKVGDFYNEASLPEDAGFTGSFKKPLAEQIATVNNQRIYNEIIMPRLLARGAKSFSHALQTLGKTRELTSLDMMALTKDMFKAAADPEFNRHPAYTGGPAGTFQEEMARDFGIRIQQFDYSHGGWGSTSRPRQD